MTKYALAMATALTVGWAVWMAPAGAAPTSTLGSQAIEAQSSIQLVRRHHCREVCRWHKGHRHCRGATTTTATTTTATKQPKTMDESGSEAVSFLSTRRRIASDYWVMRAVPSL